MGEASFRVKVSAEAWADLAEIAEYWSGRGEAWRGEKNFRDLVRAARKELTDAPRARRGRRAKVVSPTTAREILVFGVYRLIYEIDEEAHAVNLLRFWHSHRDEPGSDA
jgi:plasmid stabilization system protein ParE